MKVLIIQENGQHAANRNFRECFCMSRSLTKMGYEVEIWGKGHVNFETQPQWECGFQTAMMHHYLSLLLLKATFWAFVALS